MLTDQARETIADRTTVHLAGVEADSYPFRREGEVRVTIRVEVP
ncbi:MAG: hypothetical protein RL531_1009 [Actinomycetota bacterium]